MKTSGKGKVDAEVYNRILGGVRLCGVRLTSSQCEVRTDSVPMDKVRVAIKENAVPIPVAAGALRVDYHFEFTGMIGRKKAVLLSCCYTLDFETKEPVNEQFLSVFNQVVVRFICFPYVREYLANMLTRMNLPPFVLPLFRAFPEVRQ